MKRLKRKIFFKKRKFNQEGDLLEKICVNCRKWKSSKEFYENKKLMDGYDDYCKDCISKGDIENKNSTIDALVNKKGF
tara:strand:+ start:464 stop:697 length:234 start_codon:yes stop_codon:yes gene_type:complete